MTDKEKQEVEEEVEEEPKEPTAESKKPETEEDSQPGAVPYARFKEVNDRARAYETRLAQLEQQNADRETATETARQDRLKEQEKFQELAVEWEDKFTELEPQHDAAKKELSTIRALLEGYAEAQMEFVPELFRDVVAKLPLADRLEWLTENSGELGKDKPQGIPVTPKGSTQGELSVDDRRRRAARTF